MRFPGSVQHCSQRSPRYFCLKHVEGGIYFERKLQVPRRFAVVAESVLNHPGVILHSRVARTETQRFAYLLFSPCEIAFFI